MPDQTYECSKCKGMIQHNQLKYEKVPSNMGFGPGTVITDKGIPKCPHCGQLHFFGFKVIDIAF
jgi:NAD-dependent SIR2 family protein deacetylase